MSTTRMVYKKGGHSLAGGNSLSATPFCHSRASGNPLSQKVQLWIPAFAGMTGWGAWAGMRGASCVNLQERVGDGVPHQFGRMASHKTSTYRQFETFQGGWVMERNTIMKGIASLTILGLLLSVASTEAEAECHALNKQILGYAKSKLGQRVGRGECWDLAQAALDHHHATWKRPFNFGKRLGSYDSARVGDIIQFKNAQVKWRRGNSWGTMTLGVPHHTAMIYGINGSELRLIHQNVQGVRKVVAGTRVNLKEVVSGSYAVYRPVKCTGKTPARKPSVRKPYVPKFSVPKKKPSVRSPYRPKSLVPKQKPSRPSRGYAKKCNTNCINGRCITTCCVNGKCTTRTYKSK